jgi:hypothetical protein
MRGNGTATSAAANVASQRSRPRRPASTPARHARVSSTAAPHTTRTQARKEGVEPPSRATFMRKYGMPHRRDTAAKVAQARPLTVRSGA